MGKIKRLPLNVITKVAAGEVVERPASVVKELIDNAVDANASHIKISVEDSGFRKISVTDDGSGMSPEDLKLSFERHTTSKIKTADDLAFVRTLGFRGEALNSIASVSRLTLRSRLKKSTAGSEATLIYGELESFRPFGMPIGTEVTVENLFSNVPARKRFIKSYTTEFRLILDVITNFALSFEDVGFTLLKDGKEILSVQRSLELKDRASEFLNLESDLSLLKLQNKEDRFSLTGFVSKPELSSSRHHNYLFVDRRPVRDRIVFNAIRRAYGSLLERDSYPVTILNLYTPPGFVDVNVHPRKEEVKFQDEESIAKFVFDSVKQVLESNNLTFSQGNGSSDKSYFYLSEELKKATDPWLLKDKNPEEILQIGKLYLVTEASGRLLIFDQHAAHEKVLYNQFLKTFRSEVKNVHKFPTPVVITLSHSHTQVLTSSLEIFQKIGLKIEEFGRNTFKVEAAPRILKGQNLKKIILELLDDLIDGNPISNLESSITRILSYLSCRTAIKGGEYLTPEERRSLVKKVLESDEVYTCPHGRPVLYELPLNAFHKMFKRV